MFGNSNSSTIAKLNTGQSRQRRRWYAAVLVVAFIMMLMPLDAMSLAAGGGSLEPGDVVLNKTATPVEGMVNTWEVLLEIEAKDTVTTSDIVLVIDRSGSMSGSKLTNAKNAALEFVDVLLPSTSTRIAVVSFAGEVTINQALTNNATDLNSAINGLYANGGTFTQAAMRQAAAILANSTATYKNIVLLSDGEPTYSYGINDPYKMNTANLEPYSTYFGTAWQTTINTPQAQFNTTRVGSGSSMWQQYHDLSGTRNDKYYNNGHAAVAEAGFYKNEASLKYLYTIALDAGPNGTPILNQMASPGKNYTATESQLQAIFAAIAGEIKAAVKNASIADPMGKGFEVIGDVTDVETNSGTVNLTGTGIDWQAGTPPLKAGSTDERYAYLSYRIEINDDILDVPVPEDGLYETNGPTVVTYTNSAGSTVSGNFPIPKVDPTLLIVEKVLKNDKGDVITNDDRVFDINITSDKGYDQTYSLKAGEKKIMTNLRLEDNYSVSETGVSGTPESVLADYETTVNVYGEDQTTFVINQGAPDSPVIVTNQEKSLGQLTVKKVFNNIPDTGSVATRMMALAVEPLAFSFTVSGPDGYEQTFDLGPAGEKTFENLKYGTYTVVENTTGYYTTYDPDGGEVILSFAERDVTVTVTNRVKNGTDITATKIWQGGPTPYPEAWFRLFRSVGGGTPVAAEDAEDKKIPGSAPFTVTWEDMPQYSPEGNSYVYSVKEYIQGDTGLEHGTPAGYFKTEEGLTVTNKWISTTATINVQKALTGRDFLENDSFTFTLDGMIGETEVSDTLTVTDGTVTGFDELTFTKAGTYNFTITETGGSIGGLTYDTAAKPVTVTVVDNQDGTLTATVSPETTVITNNYVVDPAIKLEKTGSWEDVDADGRHSDGDQINYTFSVTNTGDVTLKNLILSDPKITVTGGPLATLAVGATNSSEFSGIYTLTQYDLDNGTFTNTATVTGYGPNDETVTATDDDTQTFTAAPSLSLTKSGNLADTNGDGQHSPGDMITYTFMVENTGNVTLTNVTLSDPDVSLSGGPIASLVPGDSDSTTFSATYTLTQDDIDAGTYNNTATVTGTPPEGSNVTDTDSHNEPLTREPEIDLVKTGTYEDTDDDGSVSEGDTISYVFTVTNTGNVTLTDVTLEDLNADVTVTGEPILKMVPGAVDNTTFTGSYVLTQADIDAGTFTNTATVTGTPPEGEDVSDSDDDTKTFLAEPAIELEKTGTLVDVNTNDIDDVGDQITYTFTVTNIGNVTLSNITLEDLNAAVTVTGGSIASLAPGMSDSTIFTATYDVTQADLDAGEFTNTATVTGTPPTGDDVTDSDDDTQTFTESPAIELIKTGTYNDVNDNDEQNAGDSIIYDFTVTNAGNVTLYDITLSDTIGGVTISGASIASLAPGDSDSTTFSGVYLLTQADIDAGMFYNEATVEGTSPAKTTVDDDDFDMQYFEWEGDIELIKTGTLVDGNGDGIDNIGDYITYTFTVTNTGNVTLHDVVVTDRNPEVTVEGDPIPALAPGASDSTTFTGRYDLTQADLDAGWFSNTADAVGFYGQSMHPSLFSIMIDDGYDGRIWVTDDDDDYQEFDQVPAIELIKSGTLSEGDTINYTFTVTNTGNVTLYEVIVDDPLVTVTGDPIPEMAPGAADSTTFTATYAVTQTDIDAGTFTNTATVTGYYNLPIEPVDEPTELQMAAVGNEIEAPLPERGTVTDEDTDEQTFEQDPSIDLIKTGSYEDADEDGLHSAGDVINYTFTVTNTGNVTLYDVTLTDPDATVLGGPVAMMAPGAVDSTTFSGSYVLTQADIESGTFVNIATVTGTPPTGDDETDTDEDTQTFSELTDIAISKTWIDENDLDEIRPDSITVRLYMAVGDADPTEIDVLVISGTGNVWTASFDGLPVQNIAGETLTYSVTEDAVPEYGTAISTTATGFSIINLYVPEEDIPLVVPTPTPTPEPEPTPTPTPIVIEDEEIPQTGQGGAWQGWIGLMLLAGAAAIVLFRRRRRDNGSSAK